MKITKPGQIPDFLTGTTPESIVEFDCYYCKTEFECEFKECQVITARDQRNKIFDRVLTYECPFCKEFTTSKKIKTN